LIVTDVRAIPRLEVAEQVSTVPAVSVVAVVGSQPVRLVTGLSASEASKVTTGLPVYQPLVPSGWPGDTDEVPPVSPAGTAVWHRDRRGRPHPAAAAHAAPGTA